MDEPVARATRFDHSGPRHDRGHPHAAFPGGALGAPERCERGIGPGLHLGSVVGGDHDERRFELAGSFERRNQPPADVVELDQRVLVGMLRRRPSEEVGVRIVVEVRAACAVVEEPRPLAAGLVLDEVLGVLAPLVVEQGEHRDGDLLHLLEVAVARGVHEALVEGDVLHPLSAGLAVDDLGKEVRVAPLGVHVGHRQEPVEVVEPDVLRLALPVLAHVPLAHGLGHVAGVGEDLGKRDLTLETAGHAVHRRNEQAVPHGEATGHDRRAGGCAGRLAVARGEQQAVTREPVDVGGRRAHRDAAAVAAEVAPPDVVHQDQQHVGPPAGARDEFVELGGRRVARARAGRSALPGWVRALRRRR